jgi:ribose transport system ATP-binding protein
LAPQLPISLFSGGNQQKVLIAKWLRCQPTVLLLEEPTQGVDVGAKEEIYKILREAARRGTAVVVSSSDDDELAKLCTRVLVLTRGLVAAEFHGAQIDPVALAESGMRPALAAEPMATKLIYSEGVEDRP